MNIDCSCSGYTFAQTRKLVGLSAPMLEYLCRHQIVIPNAAPCRGRGRARRYSFGDLVLLKVVSKLLANGISVSKMRAALRGLQKRHVDLSSVLKKSVLVTDGRSVYLLDKSGTLEDLRFGQMTFAFVVELNAIQVELGAKARRVDALNAQFIEGRKLRA